MIRKLQWLIRKEFLQIVRTPVLVAMLALCPVALTGIVPLGLGDDAGIRVGVVDPSHSPRQADIVERLEASEYIAAVELFETTQAAKNQMDVNRLETIVILQPDGREPVLAIDGAHTVQAFDAAYFTVQSLYGSDELEGMVASIHRLYAGGKGSTRYYLVTMIVFLLALVGCCLPMLSVVWEMESRRLGHLRSTGTGAGLYLSGKMLFCLLTVLAELVAGLLIARLMHGLTCTGQPAALFLLAACFVVAIGNLGILLALAGNTQIRCIYLFVFVFIILVLLSTMFAPLDNMSPAWAATRYVNPLFWMVDGSWKVLLKGAGTADILPHCGVLLAIGLVLAVVNFRGLRKQ